jgi:hypothetical protein
MEPTLDEAMANLFTSQKPLAVFDPSRPSAPAINAPAINAPAITAPEVTTQPLKTGAIQ